MLGPGHNVPLQGQQGSRGCIPDSPEVRPHLEGKQSTLLSSQVATGISWSPLSGLKGPSGDLPDPGIKPASLASPALASGFFTTEPPGKPQHSCSR